MTNFGVLDFGIPLEIMIKVIMMIKIIVLLVLKMMIKIITIVIIIMISHLSIYIPGCYSTRWG